MGRESVKTNKNFTKRFQGRVFLTSSCRGTDRPLPGRAWGEGGARALKSRVWLGTEVFFLFSDKDPALVDRGQSPHGSCVVFTGLLLAPPTPTVPFWATGCVACARSFAALRHASCARPITSEALIWGPCRFYSRLPRGTIRFWMIRYFSG